jgi:3-oxoacyl-[acyl-carrier-protein] synthase III
MYMGNICFYLGSSEDIAEIPYIKSDSAALRTLSENRMVKYTKLDVSVAKAAEQVLSDVISDSAIDTAAIGGVVFSRICDTNAAQLDEEFDAALTRIGLKNVPLYHIAGGQCGTGALQLKFTRDLIENDGLDNIIVISSNVVDDTQHRNQVGNTVCLADGCVGFRVSKHPLEYEIVGTAVYFDHELRGLQASADFADSLRAFKSLGGGLKGMLQKIRAQVGSSADSFRAVITSNSYNAVGQLTEALGIPEEKIFTENIPVFAHTFGSEVYHSLELANEDRKYDSGDLILLYHCGYSVLGLTAVKKV